MNTIIIKNIEHSNIPRILPYTNNNKYKITIKIHYSSDTDNTNDTTNNKTIQYDTKIVQDITLSKIKNNFVRK